MSGTELIADARAAGVDLAIERGLLVLEWDEARPPPSGLIEAMRAHKGAIVEALSVSSSRRRSAWFDVAGALATDDEWNTSREARAERAAIMEIDGGLPREWAEALAATLHGPPPHNLSRAQWAALHEPILRFADKHGAQLAALGWRFEEVFGAPKNWFRLDQRGVGWVACNGEIVHACSQSIAFVRDGSRFTHKRAPTSA